MKIDQIITTSSGSIGLGPIWRRSQHWTLWDNLSSRDFEKQFHAKVCSAIIRVVWYCLNHRTPPGYYGELRMSNQANPTSFSWKCLLSYVRILWEHAQRHLRSPFSAAPPDTCAPKQLPPWVRSRTPYTCFEDEAQWDLHSVVRKHIGLGAVVGRWWVDTWALCAFLYTPHTTTISQARFAGTTSGIIAIGRWVLPKTISILSCIKYNNVSNQTTESFKQTNGQCTALLCTIWEGFRSLGGYIIMSRMETEHSSSDDVLAFHRR